MRRTRQDIEVQGTWFVVALLGLGASSSCNKEHEPAASRCGEYCEVGCEAARECGLVDDVAACTSTCSADLGYSDCRDAVPLDRLTCAEHEHLRACASHCESLCERASECATFDERVCRIGCAEHHGTICNPASVPARSCDQIKVEARTYDFAGRAIEDGSEYAVGVVFGSQLGLCDSPLDCTAPEVCSAATNTCAACTLDSECNSGPFSLPRACVEGACADVDCLSDDHCPRNGFCDVAARVCHECKTSQDCVAGSPSPYVLYPACDVETFTCVGCVGDADCIGESPDFGDVCDTKAHRCVDCMSDADCKEPGLTRCDVRSHFCHSA